MAGPVPYGFGRLATAPLLAALLLAAFSPLGLSTRVRQIETLETGLALVADDGGHVAFSNLGAPVAGDAHSSNGDSHDADHSDPHGDAAASDPDDNQVHGHAQGDSHGSGQSDSAGVDHGTDQADGHGDVAAAGHGDAAAGHGDADAGHAASAGHGGDNGNGHGDSADVDHGTDQADGHRGAAAAGHGHAASAGHGGDNGDHSDSHEDAAASAGHGGDHGDSGDNKEARAFSVMVMGMVAFQLLMLYILNVQNAKIRKAAWGILSNCISIFCAVLAFGSLKSLVQSLRSVSTMLTDVLVFGTTTNYIDAEQAGDLFLMYVVFVLLYISVNIILFMLRRPARLLMLHAATTVFAHLMGFAALYSFSGLQVHLAATMGVDASREFQLLNRSLVIVGSTLSMLLMVWLMSRVRWMVARALGEDTDSNDTKRWMHHVKEVEAESISFCVGYLVVQLTTYEITGVIMSYDPHHAPESKTQADANSLLGWTAQVAFVSVFGVLLMFCNNGHGKWWYAHIVFQSISAMATFWSILYWVEWQVYAAWGDVLDGVRIVAVLVQALMVTFASLLLIFPLEALSDYLHAKTLHTLSTGFGLLVGISWEKVFDVALHDVAHTGMGSQDSSAVMHELAVVVVVLLMPAWYFFIVPNSIYQEEHGESQMSEEELAASFHQHQGSDSDEEDDFDTGSTQLKLAVALQRSGTRRLTTQHSADLARRGSTDNQGGHPSHQALLAMQANIATVSGHVSEIPSVRATVEEILDLIKLPRAKH